jgi:pimeloyl-ACP methyl ester carboxylesterase
MTTSSCFYFLHKIPMSVSFLFLLLGLGVGGRNVLVRGLATTTTTSSNNDKNRFVFPFPAASKSDDVPDNIKVLILPGFGNDRADYTMPGSLVDSLVGQCGYAREQIDVLDVRRADWIQVFWRGLGDVQFWSSTADPTRPAFRWYLQRVVQQLNDLLREEDDRVVLVGHSAGGWLGRAALGYYGTRDGNDNSNNSNDDTSSSQPSPSINLDRVAGLVSLGAPHRPPPPELMDMTRGALRITDERFPGSFHDGLFYVTVVGRSVRGVPQRRRFGRPSSLLEPTTRAGFAYTSYEACCGRGDVMGDGVVPFCTAHLDGAVQIDLDGVLHSIDSPDDWYGSPSVIQQWHGPVRQQLQQQQQQRRRASSTGTTATDGMNALMTTFTNALEGMFPINSKEKTLTRGTR